MEGLKYPIDNPGGNVEETNNDFKFIILLPGSLCVKTVHLSAGFQAKGRGGTDKGDLRLPP